MPDEFKSGIEIQIRNTNGSIELKPSDQQTEKGEVVRYRNLTDRPVALEFGEDYPYDQGRLVIVNQQSYADTRVRDDIVIPDDQEEKEFKFKIYIFIILFDRSRIILNPDIISNPKMRVRRG